MTALDRLAGNVALTQISKYGQAVTVQMSDGNRPPVFADYAVKAVLGAYSARRIMGAIQIGDLAANVSAQALTNAGATRDPAPGDRVVVAGTTRSVVSVESVWSGAAVALHVLQLR